MDYWTDTLEGGSSIDVIELAAYRLSELRPLILFPTEGFWSNCGLMAFKEGLLLPESNRI